MDKVEAKCMKLRIPCAPFILDMTSWDGGIPRRNGYLWFGCKLVSRIRRWIEQNYTTGWSLRQKGDEVGGSQWFPINCSASCAPENLWTWISELSRIVCEIALGIRMIDNSHPISFLCSVIASATRRNWYTSFILRNQLFFLQEQKNPTTLVSPCIWNWKNQTLKI